MLSRCIVQKLKQQPDPCAVARLVASRDGPAVLESSLARDGYARWSIYAWNPVRTVTTPADSAGCPFARLAAEFEQASCACDVDQEVPFCGGWIGYFSYEAGLATEGIPAARDPEKTLPLARFALYDTAVVCDSQTGDWFAVAVDWDRACGFDRPPAKNRLAEGAGLVENACGTVSPRFVKRPQACAVSPSLSHKQYLEDVQRILDYIAAGDVYQVNLTNRFRSQTNLSPVDLYLRLGNITPSSHGAFLWYDDFSIVSSSPELFLQTQGNRIVTRPVKGTRPRSHDSVLDRTYRAALETSEKDAAELAMIVDLMRNDLGRVCQLGSVRVTDKASIEANPTVYHRVATVTGTLRDSVSLDQILRATCPGGSITGAPKIRAMQIISQLEPTRRGAYCGSIGWIGLDGSIHLNLAIRTMVQRGQTVDLYAGGGIVADSDPNDEYDEVMAKLSGMAQAVGCSLPDQVSTPNLVEVSTS